MTCYTLDKNMSISMGHKAHPLSLRRASGTRHQDSLWYSGYYRSTLVLRDVALHTYMRQIAMAMQVPQPRMALQHSHSQSCMYIYGCLPHGDRRTMAPQCGTSTTELPTSMGLSMWQYQPHGYVTPEPGAISTPLPRNHIMYMMQHTHPQIGGDAFVHHLVSLARHMPAPPATWSHTLWLLPHMQRHVQTCHGGPVHMYPVYVANPWRDAGYLADEIAWYLERRVRFPMLKRALTKRAQDMPGLTGVRVAISGRVGGRSKKSQRARCDVWKYGATPLHVFSRPIDYAQRTAHTSLGTMGISVWLSYN